MRNDFRADLIMDEEGGTVPADADDVDDDDDNARAPDIRVSSIARVTSPKPRKK